MKREYKLEQKAGEIAQVAIVESSAIGIPNDHIEPWVKDFAIGVAVATAKWADSHPAWVSVEERLPEENTAPLVRMDLTEKFGEETILYDVVVFDGNGFHTPYKVTHWMEITPPVKKGGQDAR